MPYNCEDCGNEKAKMNMMLEIRLCPDCADSFKYKLICKSNAIEKYNLTKSDFNNYPYKEFLCKNPHKSSSIMTLYLESEVFQLFFSKHENLITNELGILNPEIDIPKTVSQVLNHIKQIKLTLKQNKFDKILDKHNVVLNKLPQWVQIELNLTNTAAEYDRIISSYLRYKKIYSILKSYNIEKYINIKISHDYIYGYSDDKELKPEQIPYLILFMLNKKKLLKNAIVKYNLPPITDSKYKNLYLEYVNSTDTSQNFTISNDLDTLVQFIQDKEFRSNELITKLKARGLELRSDSVLCSKYLSGDDQYDVDEIVDIMEQMKWFFSNTNYSEFTRLYDEKQRKFKYNNYRNYEYDSDDSDDSDESDFENKKNIYNKNKSNYAKKQSIIEWIKTGKNGIPPPLSLNQMIAQIECELINNKKIYYSNKTRFLE